MNDSGALGPANSTVLFENYTVALLERHYEQTLVAIVTWFTVASFFGAVSGNLLFVLVYVKHRHLRTPFNAYIFSLALTDLLLALTALPGNFVTNLFGYWPWTTEGCTLLLYCNTVIGSALRFQHLLISINRLWAVSMPVQFRAYHTYRTANAIIIFAWILVHAFQLPVVILGRQGIKADEKPCILHTAHLFNLALFSQIIGFIVPEILVVVTSACIFYLIRSRLARKTNRVAQAIHVHTINRQMMNTGKLPDSDTKTDTQSEWKTDGRISPDLGDISSLQNSTVAQVGLATRAEPPKTPAHSHDRVLAYLVTATVICWTPNHVYFTMVRVSNYWNPAYFAVQYCVFYANSWLNPIICYFALIKFRVAINNLLRCRN